MPPTNIFQNNLHTIFFQHKNNSDIIDIILGFQTYLRIMIALLRNGKDVFPHTFLSKLCLNLKLDYNKIWNLVYTSKFPNLSLQLQPFSLFSHITNNSLISLSETLSGLIVVSRVLNIGHVPSLETGTRFQKCISYYLSSLIHNKAKFTLM